MDFFRRLLLFQLCSSLIAKAKPFTSSSKHLISHTPRSHRDHISTAPENISLTSTEKFHKGSRSSRSNATARRNRDSRQVHSHGAPVSVISRTGRHTKSGRSKRIAQSSGSASSVKVSSRRRRRSVTTAKKVTWTAPRRRRSASLTADQTIMASSKPLASSPDASPDYPDGPQAFKASTLSQHRHTKHFSKAVPTADAEESIITETVPQMSKSIVHTGQNVSKQMTSDEDVSSHGNGRGGGILLHLRNRVQAGQSAVLVLCALLTLGVLIVGGAVLCAGLDDSDHSEDDWSPPRAIPRHHLQEDPRYSIESQMRHSHSIKLGPPADPPRPSSLPRPAPSLAPLPSSPPAPVDPAPPALQFPGSLVPTPQPKPKQKEKSAKREDVSKDGKAADHLCPSLVVPSGMEFVFAVREDLDNDRQELNFNIVDLKGAPLSRVVVSEKGDINTAGCGIFLQTLTRMPLAMVDMKAVHEKLHKSPVICRPNGEVFGHLKHEESGRYMLKNKAGKGLLIFHGDFAEKAVNVMNTVGKLVCATERCVVDFDSAPHYQVRIAPHVDAGLVICGLLTIDKLEAKNQRSP